MIGVIGLLRLKYIYIYIYNLKIQSLNYYNYQYSKYNSQDIYINTIKNIHTILIKKEKKEKEK